MFCLPWNDGIVCYRTPVAVGSRGRRIRHRVCQRERKFQDDVTETRQATFVYIIHCAFLFAYKRCVFGRGGVFIGKIKIIVLVDFLYKS